MKTKVYCGPITHLQGKTALLNPDTDDSKVLAQFDDYLATMSGVPFESYTWPTMDQTPPTDCLAYGWHAFPADHFKERE